MLVINRLAVILDTGAIQSGRLRMKKIGKAEKYDVEITEICKKNYVQNLAYKENAYFLCLRN